MYCKRGLDYLLMKAKRTAAGRDLKKFLNFSIHGLEMLSPLNALSDNIGCSTVSNKNSSYRRPKSGITFSCFNENRKVQTTERRCVSTYDEHPVISSSSSCEKVVPYEDLASRLLKCSSVQEQMEELCRILCLTPEDRKRREQLCLYIQELLSPFFKNSKVQMYGSSSNGFGFKGCDIDMSLSIIGDNRKGVHSCFDSADVPSVQDVINGKVSLEYIAELPQEEQLLFACYVLCKYYKESSELPVFINVVPIVRFHHDKYHLKCDLSFSNSVAFHNTKLLKLCGLLDERVTPLMMTIRYWAKHIGLSFNTYTISLLVLYFLQTRTPPVVPSVKHLLSLSGYLHSDDMEDDSYLQDIKKIPASGNKQTTVELLKEFFYFYAYFDYKQVICPLTASSVPRTEIHVHHKYFQNNSTICIQDPIELKHNVAHLVHFKYCKKFLNELLIAVKLFHEENLLFPSSLNWGILSLLEKPENYSATLFNGDRLLSFQIPCIPSSTENDENKVNSYPDKDVKRAWFQKMSQIVLSVLEHALLFECKVEENSERPGHSHFDLNQSLIAEENQTLVSDDHHQHVVKTADSAITPSIQLKDFPHHERPSFTINCITYHNTWSGREDWKMKVCLSNSLYDPLETEHAISVKLIGERKKDDTDYDKKKGFSFLCECYELDYGKQTSLLIKLKPFQRKNFNPILGLFLKEYVPKTVNRIFESANAQLSRQKNALNSV